MSVQPGSVVRFRHREWVVLPSADSEVVLLRPLTASSDEALPVHRQLADLLAYSLPSERIKPAQFPLPKPDHIADAEAVRLLGHAARLLLREGAAPFRSLSRISVRPRPYQLVPLLMALRLDPVRLLIADDVGVGKTIEAGLIARELWDSYAIRRLVVLCPPTLVEQWATELREKFHLEPVIVASSTLASLERALPPGRSLYRHYPVIVASIDFLKLPRNREPFLAEPPDLVIVDEAHGVVPASSGERDPRHLRYELVKRLAHHQERHLILLTATPHSGVQQAFQRLLGLLDPAFEQWDPDQLTRDQQERLARHLVQRTRADISRQWPDAKDLYPKRVVEERTYTLSPSYRQLFEATFDFCKQLIERSRQLPDQQRRFQWWAALTLLRCVMSSPRAGLAALERREISYDETEPAIAPLEDEAVTPDALEPTERKTSDEVPTLSRTWETGRLPIPDSMQSRLRALIRQAKVLASNPTDDTKLQECLTTVRQLLRQGFNPILWCFFVDTAEYVADFLKPTLCAEFPNLGFDCITGRLGDEERHERVRQLAQYPQRVLIATDCLSEGINLQELFNAALHYDLPWNPNRLEQREGRVDRFGQPSRDVTVVRLYGRDNPVDAEVIAVLIEKADRIRRHLGTNVPVPEDEGWLAELLVHRLFVRPRQSQLALPLDSDQAEELLRRWDEDANRERIRRTRFAQYQLKAEAVMEQLAVCDTVLGNETTVREFLAAAIQRLGGQVQPAPDQTLLLRALSELPEPVRMALPRKTGNTWQLAFTYPPPARAEWVGRNHPFVTALARYLFELAFESPETTTAVARIGVVRTSLVRTVMILLLLRARFLLRRPGRPDLILEDVLTTGCDLFAEHWLSFEQARELLDHARPEAEIPPSERRELLTEALDVVIRLFQAEPAGPLAELLTARSNELLQAHRRVHEAAGAPRRGLALEPLWPPDLVALLVAQPLKVS